MRIFLLCFFLSFLIVASIEIVGGEETEERKVEERPNLDGFFGIRWGEKIKNAKTMMLKRKGIRFEATFSSSSRVVFSGGTFSGYTPEVYVLDFDEKYGLYQGGVVFNPSRSEILNMYRRMKSSITKKYGIPDEDEYSFEPPFTEGDGYELTAISTGRGSVSCSWYFPVMGKEDNVMGMKISECLRLYILYKNGEISKILNNEGLEDF